jgi:UDPglucose 6-dehydrogenase
MKVTAGYVGLVSGTCLTEWKVFSSPDFSIIKVRLKQPVIFDGRNLYDPASVTALGIEYHGIGRGN